MNTPCLPFFAALLAIVLSAGCGSIELASSGNPDRVLTGTVNAGVTLPAGAEVTVRLVGTQPANDALRPAAGDVPVMARPTTPGVERIFGEHTQVLAAGSVDPVPFRLEYHAEDAVLRRGLNLDVRVSVGGKLKYRTVSAHVVTLASSPFKQDVAVQPVAR